MAAREAATTATGLGIGIAGNWETDRQTDKETKRQTNRPAPKRHRLFFRLPALRIRNGNEPADFGVTRFSISKH